MEVHSKTGSKGLRGHIYTECTHGSAPGLPLMLHTESTDLGPSTLHLQCPAGHTSDVHHFQVPVS